MNDNKIKNAKCIRLKSKFDFFSPSPRQIVSCTALLIMGFLPATLISQESKIDQAKSALEQWVETERVISEERKNLALGKEMLKDRIDLVKREIESLRSKVTETETSIAEADKDRAGLIVENDRLRQASASLGDTLGTLEQGTLRLLARVPDPLRERVKPLSQRIPENPTDTKLTISERFQNVVGILNETNKFSREITVSSEVRTLPDGSSSEVTAIYLGIAQGYYSSADAKLGGYGMPTEQGWAWKADDASAAQISRIIAIMKNEQVAAYVPLPMEIK